MAKRNALEMLLELIDTEMARHLLADLRDDEKRSFQIYGAANRFLDRHNFKLSSLMLEEADLGELQKALDEFQKMELEDIDMTGMGKH